MPDDEEERQEQFEPVGFAGVATFIASDKEHSTSIYRQFQKIAARNILYLQSELRELELRQEEFDRDDANGDLDATQAAMDWQEFCDRARDPDDDRARERMQLVKDIREKVKEYRKSSPSGRPTGGEDAHA
jgi:hypothetical protein